jgi:hypothetical protein
MEGCVVAKLSKDLSAGVLHPRENIHKTATLASLNAEMFIDCDGCETVLIDIRGTYVGTVEVAASVDGTNYIPVPVRMINNASVANVLVLPSAYIGIAVAQCGGFASVRVRMTAWTSGAAIVKALASIAALSRFYEIDGCDPLHVTVTAAVTTAATLTLPAPGAGLRIYLSSFDLERIASLALTASGTPVLVTTTNLPGAPVFNVATDAAAIGVIDRQSKNYGRGLAASAQNTAVTFVAPIFTGVIWRMRATYYVAP